jgi:tape measure domain-containing protein
MSTYELNIDGSSAEAGAARIEKSFDQIKAAATRMEGGVVEAAKRMVAAFSQLSNVRTVSREAIDSLASLGSTLSKYRGPSKTSIDNTASFLTVLRTFASVRAPSSAGLAKFLDAINKFAGPTPTAGRNTQGLLSALQGFSGISGAGARVTNFLATLGAFKGPHANAGKNVQALFSALQGFTGLPRGFGSASAAFIAFAAAIDKATASYRELRSVSGNRIPPPPSAPTGSAAGGAGGAGGARAIASLSSQSRAVRQLAADHDFLQTSIFRTRTAFNSLGGIFAAKEIITASNDVLKINAQLGAATGSAQQARVQFAYLQETTQRLGLDLVSTAKSYGLFLGSIKGTNVTIKQGQQIFEGFATAGRALQLSTGDMDGVFRALGQIISKGKLQAEELRGQLGDRLPGAFVRMANALGLLPSQLDAAMKKGEISGKRLDTALLKMAASLKNEFAGAARDSSLTVEAAFNRTRNAFVLAAAGLGRSGLNEGLIAISDALTKFIQSEGLANFASGLGKVFKFLGDNVNTVAYLLGGYALASVGKWAFGAAASALATRKAGESVGYFSNLLNVYRDAQNKANASLVQSALAANGLTQATGATATATTAATTATRNFGLTMGMGTANVATGTTTVTSYTNALRSVGLAGASTAGTLNTVATATSGVGTATASVATAATKAATGVTTYGTSVSGLTSSMGGVTRAVGTATSSIAGQGTAIAGAARNLGGFSAASTGFAAATGSVTSSVQSQSGAVTGAGGAFRAFGAAASGASSAVSGAAQGIGASTGTISGLGNATTLTSGAMGGLGVVTKGAAAATTVLIAPTRAATIASIAQAAGTGLAATATTAFTATLALLRAALLTLPFLAIVAAIAGLVYWFSNLKSESDKASEALRNVAGSQEEAQNYAIAYATRVRALTGDLDKQAVSLRNTEIATINLRNAQAGKVDTGLQTRYFKKGEVIGKRVIGQELDPYATAANDGTPVYTNKTRNVIANNSGTVTTFNGKLVGVEVARALSALVTKDAKGNVRLRTDYNTKEDYTNATLAQGYLGGRKDLSPELNTLVGQASTVLYGVRSKSRAGDKGLGFNTDEVDKKIFGKDPNNPVAPTSIAESPKTGDAAAAKKAAAEAKKAARAAATAGRQDEADLRRALEGVRDVRRETVAAYDTIKAFASSSLDGIAQAGRAAAVGKLDNIEDSYASPERAQAGIVKLTGMLKAQAQQTVAAIAGAQALVTKAAAGGIVPDGALENAKRLISSTSAEELAGAQALASANVSAYGAARKAAEDYLGTQLGINEARKKEISLAQEIREQNDNTTRATGGTVDGRQGVDLVAATVRGGKALDDANRKLEIQKKLVGVLPSDYEQIYKDLMASSKAAADLNTQLEIAKQLNTDILNAQNMSDTAGLYTSGLKPDDIEFYKTLIEYRNELAANSSYDGATIDALVAEKRGVLELESTYKQLQDQQEKIRQLSQDQADAIVDGFRKGAEEGQSFLKTLKNIFKDLQSTLLNFVLYNPLKNFLGDLLSGANSEGTGTALANSTRAQASKFTSANALDLLGGLGSSNSDVSGGFTGVRSGGGAAAAQAAPGAGLVGSVLGTIEPVLSTLADGTKQNATALAGVGNDIVVSAAKNGPAAQAVALTREQKKTDQFSGLKKIFNSSANFSNLKGGFSEMKDAFGKTGGITKNLGQFGKGLGSVAKAAGNAFAAYSVGKSVAKSIGIKGAGAEAVGGAAAGYSIGGPIGAAVGGALGLAKGLLFKKNPKAAASVIVSAEGGRAETGTVTSSKGGNKAGVSAAAAAGSSLFSSFASNFDAYLKAGNYGTFGQAKIKGKDNDKFYSVTGRVDKKGRPVGVQGVDYLNTDDEDALQAFALKTQINSGKIGGLNPVYQTIAKNTTAKSTTDLNTDLGVGTSYLNFIETAKVQSDLKKQTEALDKSYKSLTRSSAALGLDTAALTRAYSQQKNTLKNAFNTDINQQILSIKDPLLASYNTLVAEYEQAVGNAQAVGGDLTKVEELYGLKRLAIVKDYNEQMTSSVNNAAKNMLTSLTATTSSPLSASTTFDNAQKGFKELKGQINGGDISNIDDLQTLAQNYLDTARNISKSSADYFVVFNEVTDFLKSVSTGTYGVGGTGPTTSENLPELPGVNAIIEKLSHANDELLGVTKNVGTAIVEAGTESADLLTSINAGIQTLVAQSAGTTSSSNLLTPEYLNSYGKVSKTVELTK